MPLRSSAGASSGLERNVRVFSATSFFNDTASEMAYWILPAFLASIGAGPAALGLIEGLAESVASFAKLFSGLLTDRVLRRKPIVVAGYAVANAAKPLLAITTGWWQVLLIRFADRLAKGVRGAPRDVMVVESVGGENVGAAYGLVQAMDSAGAVAGPLLAFALLTAGFGMRGVFWVAAIPGLISIAVVIAFARETGRPYVPGQHAHVTEKRQDKLGRKFYLLLFAVTLFSLGNSSDMFLILRAQNLGISPRHAPLLGLVFNLTYTAFSWPAGKLSDHVSRTSLAAAGYIIFAVVYAVFGATLSAGVVWAMMALYGCYYALTRNV